MWCMAYGRQQCRGKDLASTYEGKIGRRLGVKIKETE